MDSVRFTHKLYPTKVSCLLPNTSFKKVTWNDDLPGINWRFEDCSKIRTSGEDDSNIVFELCGQMSPARIKLLLRDLGYIE